ncbi:hypothetical protein B0H14DRAFT_3032509 [Mycena olivaceomarginata]|nr:hypothetical protein B0H14DRAFT_3032509 [Mycena olivaceomarginata]
MAPAPAASDVASHNGEAKTKKSPSRSKDAEVVDSDEDDESEKEDYEIEAILEAKKGQFKKNPQNLGYYVKWKGYDETHNSWVMEDDANAPELIKAFRAACDKKNKSPRKAAGEPASKRGARISLAAYDLDAEASPSASAAKKRARKSSVKAADKEEDPDERPTKKPRENNTLRSASTTANEPTENIEIGDMLQHMHTPTWEHLIKIIDTVDQVDKQLVILFTLQTGEHMKADSEVCHEKFPKKLLRFYEGNLRWKESIEMV